MPRFDAGFVFRARTLRCQKRFSTPSSSMHQTLVQKISESLWVQKHWQIAILPTTATLQSKTYMWYRGIVVHWETFLQFHCQWVFNSDHAKWVCNSSWTSQGFRPLCNVNRLFSSHSVSLRILWLQSIYFRLLQLKKSPETKHLGMDWWGLWYQALQPESLQSQGLCDRITHIGLHVHVSRLVTMRGGHQILKGVGVDGVGGYLPISFDCFCICFVSPLCCFPSFPEVSFLFLFFFVIRCFSSCSSLLHCAEAITAMYQTWGLKLPNLWPPPPKDFQMAKLESVPFGAGFIIAIEPSKLQRTWTDTKLLQRELLLSVPNSVRYAPNVERGSAFNSKMILLSQLSGTWQRKTLVLLGFPGFLSKTALQGNEDQGFKTNPLFKSLLFITDTACAEKFEASRNLSTAQVATSSEFLISLISWHCLSCAPLHYTTKK